MKFFVLIASFLALFSPVFGEDVPDVYAEIDRQVSFLEKVNVEEMYIVINLTRQVLQVHKGVASGEKTLACEFPCATGTTAYELIPQSRQTVIYEAGEGKEGNRPSHQFGGIMKHCLRLKINNKDGSEAYVAIHAGNGEYVPRIPTSHGCIRLPRRAALALFNKVRDGVNGSVKKQVPVTFTGITPVFKLQ
ncbi:MAG: L,D-transpeptidase [Candidatus Taylorbacteria bacterium]|nr:L,D-transpeptidase [Candidatus Taylorbacteria bacterium]